VAEDPVQGSQDSHGGHGDDRQDHEQTDQGRSELGGHVVDTARTRADALALMTRHRYGLVVSNLRMPHLNGPALAQDARAPDHHHPVCVRPSIPRF
jgi:DNA-binding NtrC family response regulator